MRPSNREMRMTSANVLANLAGMLASGGSRWWIAPGVLGPETPLLKLPPDFAKDTPPIKIHRISEYDKDGPFWAWNWLELGEHSGTHFDAPHHWITGKDYADGYTDTLPVQRLVAPVNVLDFSAECGAEPGFPADHRPCEGMGGQAWRDQRGRMGGAAVRLGQARHDENLFLNANETGPHTPGPTAEVIQYLIWTRASSAGAASASAPMRGRQAA
jgi:kynurenine formamidase